MNRECRDPPIILQRWLDSTAKEIEKNLVDLMKRLRAQNCRAAEVITEYKYSEHMHKHEPVPPVKRLVKLYKFAKDVRKVQAEIVRLSLSYHYMKDIYKMKTRMGQDMKRWQAWQSIHFPIDPMRHESVLANAFKIVKLLDKWLAIIVEKQSVVADMLLSFEEDM
ncbi:unnamed protein product [Cylicostephanus goldi]|uniref:Uncharacterized protein n=1 Tax=Cylicostephanus goldi TaxID=71465 RepID=A0A3P7PHJ1_CYLGO|nr:unnamed protein product [Cylicostephanus goldi]